MARPAIRFIVAPSGEAAGAWLIARLALHAATTSNEMESPDHCMPPKGSRCFSARLKRRPGSFRSVVREYHRHHIAKCNRLTVECSRLILPPAQRFKCPVNQSGIEPAIDNERLPYLTGLIYRDLYIHDF